MCLTLHNNACCQAFILQHDKLIFITPEIQKKNRQGIRRQNRERSCCQKEGKVGDGAERSCYRSQEEGKDGDGAAVEARKEEKKRMRLVGA